MIRFYRAGFLLACLPAVLAAEEPFRNLDYYAAVRLAREQNRLILLDFYTTWCGPCKLLDQNTWSDKSVQAWLKANTIPLKIDAEEEAKLAEKFKVQAYPTIVLVRPDGREAGRLVGYRDAKAFLKEVKALLSIRDAAGETEAKTTSEPPSPENTDPVYWMNLARASEKKLKDRAYALSLYVWCFDSSLKFHPEFIDTRQTVLLQHIVRFGRTYPQAQDALEERRATAENTVLVQLELGAGKHKTQRGPGGRSMERPASPWVALLRDGGEDPMLRAALDLAALNHALAEPQRNLEMFDELRKEQSPRAIRARRAMFYFAFDPLMERRRYKDIVDCAGDLSEWLAYEIRETERNAEAERAAAERAEAERTAASKRGSTSGAVRNKDASTGATKKKGDAEIQEKDRAPSDSGDEEKGSSEAKTKDKDIAAGGAKDKDANDGAKDQDAADGPEDKDASDAMPKKKDAAGVKAEARKVPKDAPKAAGTDHMAKLIVRGGGYYEALVGAKKHRLASKIAKRLVQLETSPRVYITLIRGAVRAGAARLVKKLLEEAKVKLNPAQFGEVRKAAGKSAKKSGAKSKKKTGKKAGAKPRGKTGPKTGEK